MRMLVLFVLITSCASVDYGKVRQDFNSLKKEKITIFPGHLRLLKIAGNPLYEDPVLKCGDQKIELYEQGELLKGYLAESYFSGRKPYSCLFEAKIDGDLFSRALFTVRVKRYKFKTGRLYVDKKKLILSKPDLERVLKEKAELKEVYKGALKGEIFFSEPFVAPLKSKITSPYGSLRVYNNFKKSPHLGTDFRAAVGVPIPVANDGRVVYTKDLFFSGKTVIVDHGLSVFTTYGHLSKIGVSEGDFVKKGDIVGLAGKTGRVSGPHLHWGVKIHGHWVSGFSLVEEGI